MESNPISPSHIEERFESHGFVCVVGFNGIGYRCGYLGVTKRHPYFGVDYDQWPVGAHGGLTFSAKGGLGETEDGKSKIVCSDEFWIGFDCAHCGDAKDPELPTYYKSDSIFEIEDQGTIWTNQMVKEELEDLARQVKELTSLKARCRLFWRRTRYKVRDRLSRLLSRLASKLENWSNRLEPCRWDQW